MPAIHPTAIVDPEASLAADVKVGPYAVIEGRVTLGAGVVIHPHSVIRGPCVIGAGCQIGPAAYIGGDAQHLRLDQSQIADMWLIVGEQTILREGASLNRASRPGRDNATRVGRNCFLMTGAHVGHDCQVGNHVIMANGVMLGGHVTVGDAAFLGGGCGIHQFCRIGRLAVVGGNEGPAQDVPPFSAVRYGGLKGYNAVGCRRAGLSRQTIFAIRSAFHCLETHRTMSRATGMIRENIPQLPEIVELLDFIAASRRGVLPAVRFAGAGRAAVLAHSDD